MDYSWHGAAQKVAKFPTPEGRRGLGRTESLSLEIFKTHLDKVLCSLL